MYHKIDNLFESRNFKIISVESRKGGVGKTTTALNLADLLLEKGYRVLLLDLDITGTSISGSFNNSYWGKRINSIKDYQDNNKDLNLLKFFKNHFLTGEPWPGFFKSSGIDIFRINVISSEIYAENSELICDPRIIFDELHTFWIIELIEDICNSFINECSNYKGSSKDKVAVILDNSPGYVGLGKAVHEWLADIGPDRSKFITVSSLDVQDMKSCINSIIAIDSLIDYRVEAAKLYHSLKQGNTNSLDVSGLTENLKTFFNNLATNNNNDKYSYYRNWNVTSKKPDKTKYQSFIINKVPPEIRSSAFKYNITKVFNNIDKENLFYEFTGLQDRQEPKNCVYHDNLIHFQFIEPYIEKAKAKTSQLSSLKGYFTRINTIIKRNSDTYEKESNGSDILKHINDYEHLLRNLLNKLSNANFENIVQLVEDRWHPIEPLNTLLQVIDHFDEKELEDGITFPDFIHKISLLLKRYVKYDYPNTYTVSTSILDKARLTTNAIKRFLSSQYYYQDAVGIFVNIMTTLQSRLHKAYSKPLEQISKSLSDTYIAELLNDCDKSKIETQKLIELYTLFNYAQHRIININNDFHFLIDVLKMVTIDAEDSDSEIFPNIRDILDDVIVNRNVSHKESLIRLSKAFNRAKYMSDFRKVLEENVINQWNL